MLGLIRKDTQKTRTVCLRQNDARSGCDVKRTATISRSVWDRRQDPRCHWCWCCWDDPRSGSLCFCWLKKAWVLWCVSCQSLNHDVWWKANVGRELHASDYTVCLLWHIHKSDDDSKSYWCCVVSLYNVWDKNRNQVAKTPTETDTLVNIQRYAV